MWAHCRPTMRARRAREWTPTVFKALGWSPAPSTWTSTLVPSPPLLTPPPLIPLRGRLRARPRLVQTRCVHLTITLPLVHPSTQRIRPFKGTILTPIRRILLAALSHRLPRRFLSTLLPLPHHQPLPRPPHPTSHHQRPSLRPPRMAASHPPWPTLLQCSEYIPHLRTFSLFPMEYRTAMGGPRVPWMKVASLRSVERLVKSGIPISRHRR